MFTKAKDPAQREPAMSPAPAMPRRTPRSAPSIVSADMTIVGAITAGGDIQVDGRVEGDIVTDSLTVGENAMIKGEVLAEEVIVRGVIQGSIKAEKVQLCAGARVHGDILHAALAVETGALFEGNCRHSDDPLGRKSDQPKTDSVARMETGPVTPPPVAMESLPEPGDEDEDEVIWSRAEAEAEAEAESGEEADLEPERYEPEPLGPVTSPAARFGPSAGAARSSGNGESGQDHGSVQPKSQGSDLGQINPGRMRAGTEDPDPPASVRPK